MFRVRTVLYPTDFSSYSNHAYLHAVALAENLGAAITIVYVATPDQAGRLDFWKGQLEQIRPANRNIPVSHVLLEGDPGSEIVRFADETGIELIVMGTHGRTGVERLLTGSVAEQVLRGAPCSVMCVKLPKGQREPDRPLIASDHSS
ncbi:universal stress protein [Zavarzinella formosa]|uniref:universal stress protein n=1 Tax=Zavarzinella formosa TaxID=360055 RepID=UPI0002FB4A8A|nr:universal stress protein [Zavarzinella formosa]